MFELAVLAGVLIALVRRVDLNSLATLRFRGLWFCFLAFGLKVALFALGASGSGLVVRYGVWLQFAVTLTLLALVAANLRLRGMPVVLVGLLCNMLVILLNGARMPVTADALVASGQPGVVAILQRHEDPGHTLVDAQTRLPWLGDWIPLAALNHKVVSLGDVIAAAGLTLTVGLAAPARRRPGAQAPAPNDPADDIDPREAAEPAARGPVNSRRPAPAGWNSRWSGNRAPSAGD